MRLRVLAGIVVVLGASAAASAEREIPADVYLDKLRGMWMGQILGNYAGRPSEGDFCVGYPRGNPDTAVSWDFVPATTTWDGDDDTCFEYMYMGLLAGNSDPTSADIKQCWETHVRCPSFFIANRQARWLMADGLTPPQTGGIQHNMHWYAIDSQITTEAIGAAAPGMRQRAADLAGRFGSVTNDGYAVHAAQFYAAMYAAAAFESDTETLVAMGSAVVPLTSRTYHVIADVWYWYQADKADGTLNWRDTHELLYDKYVGSGSHTRYHNFVESTVNAGLTTLAILYGQGDFKDTVTIGVLGGFDSDCNPATAGGLIGLIDGYSSLPSDLTSAATDDYEVTRLQNIVGETTVTAIAAGWQAVAEAQIVGLGGSVVETPGGTVYRLPDADPVTPPPEKYDPTGPGGLVGDALAAGRTVTTSASVPYREPAKDRMDLDGIIDGIKDVSYNGHAPYWTYDADPIQPPGGDYYEVNFHRPVTFASVVFHEGDIKWSDINGDPGVVEPQGGYFLDLTVEVLVGADWQEVSGLEFSEPLDPLKYYQHIELKFRPVVGEAVRIRGTAGGTRQFTTIVELEVNGRLAVLGDADGDDDVDFVDYCTTKGNFGRTGMSWWQGDFDFDKDVDFFDYITAKSNFGWRLTGQGEALRAGTVPEPTALALLALGAALLPRRRFLRRS